MDNKNAETINFLEELIRQISTGEFVVEKLEVVKDTATIDTRSWDNPYALPEIIYTGYGHLTIHFREHKPIDRI